MYCRTCDKYIGEPRTDFINLFLCFGCAVDYINTKNLTIEQHKRALDALSTIYDKTFK